ncbi:hypothetical protein J6590_101402 [Homalodisca vitripennis]|nr:hypothetical protein J6590_101402 [Homalodisca vitripennis]
MEASFPADQGKPWKHMSATTHGNEAVGGKSSTPGPRTGPPPDLTSGSAPYNPILSGGIRRRKKHFGSNLVQDEYGRSGWMPVR